MSLSDLASLGSFVSGFAVLVSLVFLYFQLRQVSDQVRQTEKNQQAAIRQARSTRGVDIVLRAATEPSLIEAVLKGNMGADDISDMQLMQFRLYVRSWLYEWEDAFYQHRDGLLTDSGFNALKANIRSLFRPIGFRTNWKLSRADFSDEFAQWIDKMIAEAPALSRPLATPEAWRSELAAARANAAG